MDSNTDPPDVIAVETTPRRTRARSPARKQGVIRFNELLDATEALLSEHDPESVGIHQIAERAGVLPGSAYHFFPTKEAAFLALVERHQQEFDRLYNQPISPQHLVSWQSMLTVQFERAAQYYNSNPAAMKIILGGYATVELYKADIRHIRFNSEQVYEYLDQHFHMPFLRDRADKFEVCFTIIDSIWSISFMKHGSITDQYFEEGVDASLAYCHLFLPQKMERRSDP